MLWTSGSPWWHLLLIWAGEGENWVGLGGKKKGEGEVLSPGIGGSALTPCNGGGKWVGVLGEVTGLLLLESSKQMLDVCSHSSPCLLLPSPGSFSHLLLKEEGLWERCSLELEEAVQSGMIK